MESQNNDDIQSAAISFYLEELEIPGSEKLEDDFNITNFMDEILYPANKITYKKHLMQDKMYIKY